ncbi:hypothetical protein Acr_23g0012250 [Actinidia rufa]|uniref:Uncharacterized protein n=1 Tax=Actinidia rufa TaxID=165716 RepID=A0A7J0GPU6_9ERIC|nr:hypothetical protein Acr_23g0012250 [Actinidia rufa]
MYALHYTHINSNWTYSGEGQKNRKRTIVFLREGDDAFDLGIALEEGDGLLGRATTVRSFVAAAEEEERERDCRVGLRERSRNEEVRGGFRGSREVGETEAEMRRLRMRIAWAAMTATAACIGLRMR